MADKYVGCRFGRLSVLKRAGWRMLKSGKRHRTWLCRCDCGRTCKVSISNLKSGNSTSCGCKRKETAHRTRWRGCGKLSGTYWHHTQANAKLRGLSFRISIKYAWTLFQKQLGICPLTGLALIMDPLLHETRRRFGKYKRQPTQTASLDRINSNRGYVHGNVRWVHRKVNLMRLDMTDAEFIQWCQLVVDHDKKGDQSRAAA